LWNKINENQDFHHETHEIHEQKQEFYLAYSRCALGNPLRLPNAQKTQKNEKRQYRKTCFLIRDIRPFVAFVINLHVNGWIGDRFLSRMPRMNECYE